MQVRSLGFRTDLMLRQLSGSEVAERDGYLVVRTPQNPTFYWGNFLLVPAPPRAGDGGRWLASFADEFPAARHVAIGVDGTDAALGTDNELRDAGLELEVNVVLEAASLTATIPVDPVAELRPLRTDEDWAGCVRLRLDIDEDETQTHREFVERRGSELRRLVEAGHGTYVGAFVDGALRAGLGLFTDGSGLGRYQNVETHADFRRRGLAAGLLGLASRIGAEQHGITTLVIVADPDYVAIDLYRRLGFVDSERQVQWQRSPSSAD